MYIYTLFLALPAFVANMMPVIVMKLGIMESLNTPIDNNRTIGGKPLLGSHKTWRGLVSGTIGAVITAMLQYAWYRHYGSGDIWVFQQLSNAAFFGAMMGICALFGDAFESLIKRRIGIASGKPFIPFDQIDYMFMCIIGTYMMVHWTMGQVIFLLVFTFFANAIANAVSYALGIKETYW